MSPATPAAATRPAQPPPISIYRRPRPVNQAIDSALSLRPDPDFRFASSIDSVELVGGEFAQAMHSYPIVFADGEAVSALAVLGLRVGEDLIVEPNGQWLAGHHSPLFLRRYPFGLLQHPDGQQLVLCIDEAAESLVKSDARPLFAGGRATQVIQDAVTFCGELHGQQQATGKFVRALGERGLLTRNEFRFLTASGEQLGVNGFAVIDEVRFNALPDAVFLDWRRRGWLALAYCHLMSMGNWRRLVELANRPRY